jgi:hypothetical protein
MIRSADARSCASSGAHGAVGCAEPCFDAENRHHRIRQRVDRAVRRRIVPDMTQFMTHLRSFW